jgi:hypothetical protein
MDNIISTAFKTFSFKIGNFTISPNYIQAILILLLIFMLVFTMARMHHMFIRWSFKGAIVGVLIGFLLALIVEGFFIVGGSTILTATLGWKNAPKPIAKVLDDSRSKLQGAVCESKQ